MHSHATNHLYMHWPACVRARSAHQETVHSSQRTCCCTCAWCTVRATYIYINCAIAGELHKIATKCVCNAKNTLGHTVQRASGTPVAFIYFIRTVLAMRALEQKFVVPPPRQPEQQPAQELDTIRTGMSVCTHAHNNLSPPLPLLPLLRRCVCRNRCVLASERAWTQRAGVQFKYDYYYLNAKVACRVARSLLHTVRVLLDVDTHTGAYTHSHPASVVHRI